MYKLLEKSIEYFWRSIFDAYFESIDAVALSTQKLIDITLVQEQDDGGLTKPTGVADLIKQIQSFLL